MDCFLNDLARGLYDIERSLQGLAGIGVNLRKEFDQDQFQNFFVFVFHSNNILQRKEFDN